MRTLLLFGLINMISFSAFAGSPIDLVCSWDNGNGVFFSMNIPSDGATARLDKDSLSEYKIDLFAKNNPYNGKLHVATANTGKQTLPSFSLNDPNATQFMNGNMHLNSNNEMTFGYYDLNAGIYTLSSGPVRLKLAVPRSVVMDSSVNKIQNVGRAAALFSNGDLFLATCDLLYNHE